MTKIKVGVVGAGYWGPNLVRNFRSLSEDCHLTIVCDTRQARLKHITDLYSEVTTTLDYGHTLNGIGLDAVVIATPLETHYHLAKAALEAGKHVLIEKPMAGSEKECEELIMLAKKNGLILMNGHTFLYSPAIRKIKEIISKGDLGDIRYISARRLNLGIYQKHINVAWDLAPHDISIILHILGAMPETVNCRGSAHITKGIEDVAMMYLGFSNQRSAIIQSSWLDPRKVREMTIVGSKRMIVYDDVAPLEKVSVYDARVRRVEPSPGADPEYSYHQGDMYAPYIKQEEPLKVMCQHFLDCIKDRAKPISAGEEGLEVVRILTAASMSLEVGGAEIRLPKPLSGNRFRGTKVPESLDTVPVN